MESIDYTYIVDAINDEGDIATVTYTPADERLKAVTRAVSVPLRKARDTDHAKDILEQKCRQRAPLHEWTEALDLLEGRQTVTVEEAVSAIRADLVGTAQRVEPPKVETREERIRREFVAG